MNTPTLPAKPKAASTPILPDRISRAERYNPPERNKTVEIIISSSKKRKVLSPKTDNILPNKGKRRLIDENSSFDRSVDLILQKTKSCSNISCLTRSFFNKSFSINRKCKINNSSSKRDATEIKIDKNKKKSKDVDISQSKVTRRDQSNEKKEKSTNTSKTLRKSPKSTDVKDLKTMKTSDNSDNSLSTSKPSFIRRKLYSAVSDFTDNDKSANVSFLDKDENINIYNTKKTKSEKKNSVPVNFNTNSKSKMDNEYSLRKKKKKLEEIDKKNSVQARATQLVSVFLKDFNGNGEKDISNKTDNAKITILDESDNVFTLSESEVTNLGKMKKNKSERNKIKKLPSTAKKNHKENIRGFKNTKLSKSASRSLVKSRVKPKMKLFENEARMKKIKNDGKNKISGNFQKEIIEYKDKDKKTHEKFNKSRTTQQNIVHCNDVSSNSNTTYNDITKRFTDEVMKSSPKKKFCTTTNNNDVFKVPMGYPIRQKSLCNFSHSDRTDISQRNQFLREPKTLRSGFCAEQKSLYNTSHFDCPETSGRDRFLRKIQTSKYGFCTDQINRRKYLNMCAIENTIINPPNREFMFDRCRQSREPYRKNFHMLNEAHFYNRKNYNTIDYNDVYAQNISRQISHRQLNDELQYVYSRHLRNPSRHNLNPSELSHSISYNPNNLFRNSLLLNSVSENYNLDSNNIPNGYRTNYSEVDYRNSRVLLQNNSTLTSERERNAFSSSSFKASSVGLNRHTDASSSNRFEIPASSMFGSAALSENCVANHIDNSGLSSLNKDNHIFQNNLVNTNRLMSNSLFKKNIENINGASLQDTTVSLPKLLPSQCNTNGINEFYFEKDNSSTVKNRYDPSFLKKISHEPDNSKRSNVDFISRNHSTQPKCDASNVNKVVTDESFEFNDSNILFHNDQSKPASSSKLTPKTTCVGTSVDNNINLNNERQVLENRTCSSPILGNKKFFNSEKRTSKKDFTIMPNKENPKKIKAFLDESWIEVKTSSSSSSWKFKTKSNNIF